MCRINTAVISLSLSLSVAVISLTSYPLSLPTVLSSTMFWLSLYLLLPGISARTLYVVDIGMEDGGLSLGQKIAALACQGLMNREGAGEDAVFSLKEGWNRVAG